MKKFQQWSGYLLAYTMWIVSFLLWLGFMLLGRDALLGMLGIYFIGESFQRRLQAQFADRVFVFGTGLIWVILMIVVENYFRTGVKKGDLSRRLGRVLGPQVLLIFLADAVKAIWVDPIPLPWIRWVLLAIELTVGVGAIYLSSRKPRLS